MAHFVAHCEIQLTGDQYIGTITPRAAGDTYREAFNNLYDRLEDRYGSGFVYVKDPYVEYENRKITAKRAKYLRLY